MINLNPYEISILGYGNGSQVTANYQLISGGGELLLSAFCMGRSDNPVQKIEELIPKIHQAVEEHITEGDLSEGYSDTLRRRARDGEYHLLPNNLRERLGQDANCIVETNVSLEDNQVSITVNGVNNTRVRTIIFARYVAGDEGAQIDLQGFTIV